MLLGPSEVQGQDLIWRAPPRPPRKAPQTRGCSPLGLFSPSILPVGTHGRDRRTQPLCPEWALAGEALGGTD